MTKAKSKTPPQDPTPAIIQEMAQAALTAAPEENAKEPAPEAAAPEIEAQARKIELQREETTEATQTYILSGTDQFNQPVTEEITVTPQGITLTDIYIDEVSFYRDAGGNIQQVPTTDEEKAAFIQEYSKRATDALKRQEKRNICLYCRRRTGRACRFSRKCPAIFGLGED